MSLPSLVLPPSMAYNLPAEIAALLAPGAAAAFGLGIYAPTPGVPGQLNLVPTTLVPVGYTPLIAAPRSPVGQSYPLQWSALRAPNGMRTVLPSPLGTDTSGVPTLRGYEQLTLQYTRLRSDLWYWLYARWQQARQTHGQWRGQLLVLWPDPVAKSNVVATASWDAITSATRTVAGIEQVQLTFSHVGLNTPRAVGLPSGVWMGSSGSSANQGGLPL